MGAYRTGLRFYGENVRMDSKIQDGITWYIIAKYTGDNADGSYGNWTEQIQSKDIILADEYSKKLGESS